MRDGNDRGRVIRDDGEIPRGTARGGVTRREFLTTLARGLLLIGIGALAVKLLGVRLGRRRVGSPTRSGETCINRGICRGCTAFSGCGLPQALSARRRAPWARANGGKL
jgi:hypothetical protein